MKFAEVCPRNVSVSISRFIIAAVFVVNRGVNIYEIGCQNGIGNRAVFIGYEHKLVIIFGVTAL